MKPGKGGIFRIKPNKHIPTTWHGVEVELMEDVPRDRTRKVLCRPLTWPPGSMVAASGKIYVRFQHLDAMSYSNNEEALAFLGEDIPCNLGNEPHTLR